MVGGRPALVASLARGRGCRYSRVLWQESRETGSGSPGDRGPSPQLIEEGRIGRLDLAEDPSEILPSGYTHPGTGETEFTKDSDVLECGSTAARRPCAFSKARRAGVEGALACRSVSGRIGPAPRLVQRFARHRMAVAATPHTSKVVTHGWVMDEKGSENVQAPRQRDRAGKGLRAIRRRTCWLLDGRHRITRTTCRASDALLKAVRQESYRRIRNTLRFLLRTCSKKISIRPATRWSRSNSIAGSSSAPSCSPRMRASLP